MVEAGDKSTSTEIQIPISEAANRILAFYPAHIAGPRMIQGLVDGRICCAYRELTGHRAGEPTPHEPAFWKSDPRGQTRCTRFPWPGDWIRRSVQPRGYRRPTFICTAIGLTVSWCGVVAVFPALAQARFPGPIGDAIEENPAAASPNKVEPPPSSATILDASAWLPLEFENDPCGPGELPEDYVERIWQRVLAAPNVRDVKKKTVQNLYSAWLKERRKAGE
jgi:hypothetical protein